MKKRWLRKIIGGLSLTSVLFVFQACYGTPQDFQPDLFIEGQVMSENSGLPIQNIMVSVNDMESAITDLEGKFSFYSELIDTIRVNFKDNDSIQNGLYQTKDTVLTDISNTVYLDIKLELK